MVKHAGKRTAIDADEIEELKTRVNKLFAGTPTSAMFLKIIEDEVKISDADLNHLYLQDKDEDFKAVVNGLMNKKFQTDAQKSAIAREEMYGAPRPTGPKPTSAGRKSRKGRKSRRNSKKITRKRK